MRLSFQVRRPELAKARQRTPYSRGCINRPRNRENTCGRIDLAKELKLNFLAQLLTMTAMEIRTNLHGISPQEMDALCACADAQPHAAEEKARVFNFPSRGRCS